MNKSLTVVLFFLVEILSAQTVHQHCGTNAAMNDFYKKNPNAKIVQQNIDNQWFAKMNNGDLENRSAAIVTLPVVFHIIHNNGTENISDADVTASLARLNEVFSNSAPFSKSIDSKIQFCLAKTDPTGKATSGITRNVSPLTTFTVEDDDENVKNINRWFPYDYINIWVVKDIKSNVVGPGIYGYAYLANAHGGSLDGIVLESAFVNGVKELTPVFAHEMGHYLNLYHTFDNGCFNNNCLQDGDQVCDTPPDNTTQNICTFNSCTTDADDKKAQNPFKSDVSDYAQNFMDYSKLDCYESFTQGQSLRMNACILDERASLLKSKGCDSPCLSKINVNFSVPQNKVSIGTTLTFTNSTTGATSYKWLIDNVLASNNKDFTYQFDKIGKFKVTLIASNQDPICDAEKTVTVEVVCTAKSLFSLSKKQVLPNENITSSNQSTGANAYTWYINGKVFSTQKDINFSFDKNGIYTISLLAKGVNCSDSTWQTVTVDCGFNIKLASTSTTIDVNENITFTASSSVANTIFSWKINGQSVVNQSNSYTTSFASIGINTICVSATKNNCTLTECADVTISDSKSCELNFQTVFHNDHQEEAFSVSANGNGSNIYVAGRRDSAALLLTTDAKFNILKQKTFKVSPYDDVVKEMIFENDFIAYLTIHSLENNKLKATYLARYSFQNDSMYWLKKLGDADLNVKSSTIAANNIVIVGEQKVNNVDKNFVTSLSRATGDFVWSKHFEPVDSANYSISFEKAIYTGTSIWILSNYTNKNTKLRRPLLCRLNTSGTVLYSKYHEWANTTQLDIEAITFSSGTEILSKVTDPNNPSSKSIAYSTITLTMNPSFGKEFKPLQNIDFNLTNLTGGMISGDLISNGNKNIFQLNTNFGNATYIKGESFDVGGQDEHSDNEYDSNNYTINTGSTLKNNDKNIWLSKFVILNNKICTDSIPFSVNKYDIQEVPILINEQNISFTQKASKPIIKPNATYQANKICASKNRDLYIKKIKTSCANPGDVTVSVCNGGDYPLTFSIFILSKNPLYGVNTNYLASNLAQATLGTELPLQPNECRDYIIPKVTLGANQFNYVLIAPIVGTLNAIQLLKSKFDPKTFVSNSELNSECNYFNNVDSFSINPNFKKLDLGKDRENCNNGTIKLNANAKYNAYKWSDGSVDSSLTISKSGLYWLETTDTCGIVQLDSLQILDSPLKLDLGTNQYVCTGTSINLNVMNGYDTYQWFKDSLPFPCNNCTKITETPKNIKTIYSVLAKKGDCTAKDSIEVGTVNLKNIFPSEISVCKDEKITLKTLAQTESNTWFDAKTNQKLCINCDSLIFSTDKNTSIVIKGKYSQCENSDTLQVKVKQSVIDLGADRKICFGDGISLSVKDCNSIIWKENNNLINCNNCEKISVIPTSILKYSVNAKKDNCTVTGSILITPIKVEIALPNDTLLCKNDTLLLKVAKDFEEYFWTKDNENLNCKDCNFFRIINDGKTHQYGLKVRIGNCFDSDDINIGEENNSICQGCRFGTVYIPTFFSPNEDKTNDTIFPQGFDCESLITTFRIFDRWGNIVFEANDFSLNQEQKGWNGSFNGSPAASGIYVYHLEITLKSGKKIQNKGEIMLVR